MLHPRIIPCLLVHNKGLVKTVKFKTPKYVGDPINAVRIYNEKEVDELMVLDIDASTKNKEPDYKMIEKLAVECRMPLCYGGGIKSVEQAKKTFSLGVEKIALSSVAIENENILPELVQQVGSQSVVVIIDVKKKLFGGYEIVINNGLTKTGLNPNEFIKKLLHYNIGEIVINSVDNDGVMKGYDLKLIDSIKEIINIPMTILGGAGSLEDISSAINRYGIIGISAGSLFVFKGKYKAVLINYPSKKIKEKIIVDNISF